MSEPNSPRDLNDEEMKSPHQNVDLNEENKI